MRRMLLDVRTNTIRRKRSIFVVAFEATGGYERGLRQTLLEAGEARAECLLDVLTFKLEERKLGPGGSDGGDSGPVQ